MDVHHVGARQTGNETWSANIARELAVIDTHRDITFATTSAGSGELTVLTGRAPELLPARSALRLSFGLPRLLRRLDSRACLVSYTPPLDLRTPMVIAVHDLSAFDPGAAAFLPWRTAARYRMSIRFAAKRARYIVVPTQHTADDLARATSFPPGRTVIAAIPVDPRFAALLVAPRPERRPGLRVLLVGTLLPRKNVRVVADAVALLAARGRTVHLRVVGPVREAGRADEAYLNDTLGDRVSWSGYVTAEELAEEYLAADILAFPSLYEGFGIPLVEAMTAGTPVVASNASCLPEVVADAGLLAEPHDAQSWAEAFSLLADSPETAADYAARGRARAAEFSWAESGRRVYNALRAAGGLAPEQTAG